MTEQTQLIKIETDLSDEALKTLQEQANTFPAVVTTEKEYKEIYEHHQKIKKISQAVKKKAAELIKTEKKNFESARVNILSEETRIKNILTPIETKLLETRTAWEDEKERVKQEKANTEAKKQQAEFERQELIRDRQEAEIENEKFDQRKKEDEARLVEDERLKKEREAFEKEKAEFEAEKLDMLPIKTFPPSQNFSDETIESLADADLNLGAGTDVKKMTDDIAKMAKPETPILQEKGRGLREENKSLKDDFGGESNVSKMLDGCELIKPNVKVHVVPVASNLPTMQDMALHDPDKPKFDEIFMVFKELQSCVDYNIKQGFTDPDSTEAAKYIKQELYLFWQSLHRRYDF